MTISTRTAGFALVFAAPALIFLGAASANAEPSATHTGPSHSTHHKPFPHQHNMPHPGSVEHHRHQRNHAK